MNKMTRFMVDLLIFPIILSLTAAIELGVAIGGYLSGNYNIAWWGIIMFALTVIIMIILAINRKIRIESIGVIG